MELLVQLLFKRMRNCFSFLFLCTSLGDRLHRVCDVKVIHAILWRAYVRLRVGGNRSTKKQYLRSEKELTESNFLRTFFFPERVLFIFSQLILEKFSATIAFLRCKSSSTHSILQSKNMSVSNDDAISKVATTWVIYFAFYTNLFISNH